MAPGGVRWLQPAGRDDHDPGAHHPRGAAGHDVHPALPGRGCPSPVSSEWTLEISTHYLGGGRHYGEWGDWPRKWEIADIGLLVVYRQGGKVLRSKVALLQSKRLYPNEQDLDEETPLDYMAGFGRLFHSDDDWSAITQPRSFAFTEDSPYRALMTGDTQYKAITAYETQRNIPIYYLLYNPRQIPSSAVIPLAGQPDISGPCEVGCRIVPARHLRGALVNQPGGHSPAYGELRASLADPFAPDRHPAGWRLEHFVTALLLECETGYIAESRTDSGLNYIFTRRTGPIAAALAITLDAPV